MRSEDVYVGSGSVCEYVCRIRRKSSEESFVYEREFRCTHEESFETDATASVYIYI